MVDVAQGLVKQTGHMGVVEVVDHLASVSRPDDEPEVAQDTQLVGDGRLLHVDGSGQLANRARAFAEPTEDADPARRGQRPHHPGDVDRALRRDRRARCDHMGRCHMHTSLHAHANMSSRVVTAGN